ncbi:MAG: hypothetical protein F6K28_23245 [Microcoleus sp. SIO2G3]|nr:hypothetical protein [Microcoleus sp. SIO2G3]
MTRSFDCVSDRTVQNKYSGQRIRKISFLMMISGNEKAIAFSQSRAIACFN